MHGIPVLTARGKEGLERRTFNERTMNYCDVREIMEEARPMILQKVQAMGCRNA